VVWGKASFLRVVDVLNPVDNRNPGMMDVADLRLPVNMSRADVYAGNWRLMAVAVHEVAFNRNPPPGSDFYVKGMSLPLKEEVPDSSSANTEYGLALTAAMSGWDMGLYWARYFEDNPHLEATPGLSSPAGGITPPASSPGPSLWLAHSRLTMTGASVAVAQGNWLLKGEMALVQGLRWYGLPVGLTKNRMDTLLGLEFTGWRDTTLMAEVLRQQLQNDEPLLVEPPDKPEREVVQWVAALRQDYLGQTLHVMVLGMFLGGKGEKGGLQRYTLAYDLADALQISGGVLVFQGSRTPSFVNAWAHNDRVFSEIKYSF